MNRRSLFSPRTTGPLLRAVLFAGCVAAALVAPACDPPHQKPVPGAEGVAQLTILHTNDTHGHLLPFSYPEGRTGNAALDSLKDRRDIGGIARRATLVQQIRAEGKASGVPVLLLDAGDFCDGTPFSTEYHGEADLTAMNACRYDYGTFGNHEYNNTLDQVRKLARMAPGRLLCANVVETSGGRPLLPPFTVTKVGALNVGIFGLTTEESATYPAARDSLRVLPMIETARAMVDSLRVRRADVIILISHCGNSVDDRLADEVPGICAIIGGHSHSRLPAGEYFKPFPTEEKDSGGTIVVQAHQWGGELGRLDLAFLRDASGRWSMARHEARLLPITSAITPDPVVAAVVDEYWSPIAARFGEVIGSAEDDFTSRGPDRAEYNLVADAIRETFGTDIEMENLGGVRSPLVRGPVTRADLVDVDPFDNTVVTFKITGSQLKSILVHHEPAVSGIRYRIARGDLVEATVNGEPLDEARTYTGASNSYFAGKGLKGVVTWTDTGRRRLDVIVDYIREKKTVAPRYDGRRVVERNRSE